MRGVMIASGIMFGSGEAWLRGECADRTCSRVEVRLSRLQPPP
jgi:hypothetical protein